jgi:hypothetical protein
MLRPLWRASNPACSQARLTLTCRKVIFNSKRDFDVSVMSRCMLLNAKTTRNGAKTFVTCFIADTANL